MSSGRTTTSRTRSGRTRYGTVPNIRRRSRFRSWNRRRLMKRVVACLAASLLASAAAAQTVKIGVVNTFTGPQAMFGEMTERAFKLYQKLHDKDLPPGVKLELVSRDDGGPNPDKARQLAQELIVRARVHLLAGVAFKPNEMALAPDATETIVPHLLTTAGHSVVTSRTQSYETFSI